MMIPGEFAGGLYIGVVIAFLPFPALGWVLGKYSRDEADQFLSSRSLHAVG